MYYTTDYTQNASADFEKFLVIPSGLTDYINTGTSVEKTRNGVEAYCFHGELYPDSKICLCENCGCRMHIHNKYHVRLRHLCIGSRISFVMVDKNRYLCPECGRTRMQEIPFKAEQFKAGLMPLEQRQWYDERGLGIHVAYVGEIVNIWMK